MSASAFFDEAAKAAVRLAIERVEKQTCAEVVVTVRRQAGLSYRDAAVAFGAAVGLVVLLLLLFLPREFSTAWIPFDVVVSFGLGLDRATEVPGGGRVIEAVREDPLRSV